MTPDLAIPEALQPFGQPLQVCPPKPGTGRAGYFTVAGVLALLAGLTVIGIVNPPDNPPPVIVLIVVMGVLSMGAIACVGLGYYAQSYTLVLFRDALARTGGSAPEVFRWSDVKEVYTFVNPVAGKHRIVAQDGRQLEITTSVKNGKQLGEAVQQTLFDRMLPAAEKAFNAGETVAFGSLRLDQNSLYYKDKRLAWSDVAKMSLLYNAYTRSLQFEVKAAGSVLLPWCVVPAQNIPNVDVFRRLAERKKPFTK